MQHTGSRNISDKMQHSAYFLRHHIISLAYAIHFVQLYIKTRPLFHTGSLDLLYRGQAEQVLRYLCSDMQADIPDNQQTLSGVTYSFPLMAKGSQTTISVILYGITVKYHGIFLAKNLRQCETNWSLPRHQQRLLSKDGHTPQHSCLKGENLGDWIMPRSPTIQHHTQPNLPSNHMLIFTFNRDDSRDKKGGGAGKK